MVTRRGAEAAVLVPVAEWRRLQSAARPSLKQLLLSDQARTDLIVPARGQAPRRKAEPSLRRLRLLDPNVVSELRKQRPHGAVLAWLGWTTPSCTCPP